MSRIQANEMKCLQNMLEKTSSSAICGGVILVNLLPLQDDDPHDMNNAAYRPNHTNSLLHLRRMAQVYTTNLPRVVKLLHVCRNIAVEL